MTNSDNHSALLYRGGSVPGALRPVVKAFDDFVIAAARVANGSTKAAEDLCEELKEKTIEELTNLDLSKSQRGF